MHVFMYEGNIVLATTSSPGMVVSSLCYLKKDEYSQKGITLTQQYTAAFKQPTEKFASELSWTSMPESVYSTDSKKS